jgi:uncharacterized protein (DUF983 family)
MIARALLRRCPVCGQRRIFRRWFRLAERCPNCGLRFERIEGHWTGALGINTILSFGTLLLTLAVGFAVTYPDIPAVPILVVAVLVAAVAPFVYFPYSKTIWLTIDLMMRPLEPGEARAVPGSKKSHRPTEA